MVRKSSMDILYNEDLEPVSISALQEQSQNEIVSQFRACRRQHNMTQVELAKITGIPQPNITRFESTGSNPTLAMMVKMAAALGMKVTIKFEEMDNKIV